MYLALTKIGRFFRTLSPVVTAGLALLLAVSYMVLMKLGINEKYDIYYKFLTALPAAVFLLLTLAKFLSRRSHIGNRDFKYITKFFRTSEQFGHIFNQCLRIDKGSLTLLNRLDAKDNYKWPENETEIAKISSINAAAFRGTPWAGSGKEKLVRNLAMWHRNQQSFLMIMGESQNEEEVRQPVFFSHIIPLSDHGFHHYFETAESGDNEFNPNWIAKIGSPIKGLLLFTIARDPDKDEKTESGKNLTKYLYAVAYHIQAILDHYPEQEHVTLYFQNSEKKFKRLAQLAGFKKSRLLTHDDETVYVVSVDKRISTA